MRIKKNKNNTRMELKELLQVFQEISPDLKMIECPYRLFRYDKGHNRFYYRSNTAELLPYLSVTSFCQMALPTSPYLIKWIGDNGSETAEFKRDSKAEYGTLLHIEIGKALKTGGYDFNKLSKVLYESVSPNYRYQVGDWEHEMKRDLISMFQFFKEKLVSVIGLEFPVYSDECGLAGTIDLIAEVKFGRGTVNALIDFKSGKKGFFDAHKLQLSAYKKMWNEHFESVFPVTHIFNLAPVNWLKSPTYKFENQTNNQFEGEALELYLKLAKVNGWIKPPTKMLDIKGKFEGGFENFNFEDHIIDYSTFK
jgi:hypothetical protein